ncbi:MAG: hypothetical protein IT364_10085 [Candidatus Hydrogenedentes bacterium]|nr:hypothetical protein [Candidatus Hydrogenedentota bacterium]
MHASLLARRCRALILGVSILVGAIALPAFAQTLGVFDVTQHGAVGDGQTVNTQAIQAAIDACAQAGGGSVVFPA